MIKMEFTDDIWRDYGFVVSGKNRVKVIKAIGDKTLMPTQIAEESGILLNHISNLLRLLKYKELVECINPEYRKGRLYRLTEKGKMIYEKLD